MTVTNVGHPPPVRRVSPNLGIAGVIRLLAAFLRVTPSATLARPIGVTSRLCHHLSSAGHSGYSRPRACRGGWHRHLYSHRQDTRRNGRNGAVWGKWSLDG